MKRAIMDLDVKANPKTSDGTRMESDTKTNPETPKGTVGAMVW